MNLPSVSVVIVTYQRRELIAETVAAIAADRYASEIVVVVDGSRDGSFELLTELARRDRRIRPVWRDNGGDAAARQTGVEHATGEVVLLLDDDVVAGPDLARGHAEAHAGRPGTVVLGYMPVRRRSGMLTALYAHEYEAQCRRYESDPATILRAYWAGNASLRRQDTLRVGLRAGGPRLGYHSDQAFGLRCLRAGLTGVFDRGLVAEHRHERDLRTFLRQAQLRGADRRVLEDLFPDLVAPGGLDDPLPAPVRAAVAAAAAPAVYEMTSPALRWGVRRADRLRLGTAGAVLARGLRQVELRRGARDGRAVRDAVRDG